MEFIKDFVIGVSLEALQKPTLLNFGINEIISKDFTYKFEVREVPTFVYGMCYAIIPIDIYLQPFADFIPFIIAKNNTENNKEMEEVTIQISSKGSTEVLTTGCLSMKCFSL